MNMNMNDALEQIKAIYDDGVATINGRDYRFAKTVHKKRLRIYSFLTKIRGLLEVADHSFLDWPEYEKIEKTVQDIVLFDNMQLSKSSTHWEQYPEDYVLLMLTAMQVISYPLWLGVVSA